MSLYRWASGKQVPPLEYAIKLRQGTGIPLEAWVSNGRRVA